MLPLALVMLLSAPNVVLISVDTLRADHLGFYGHPYDTSPNLDRLAEESMVFEDMVCEIPLTGPSFTSMMTSRYPRTTGVTRNGLRLPEEVSTVAQRFQAEGYETVCVQSNWTLKSKLAGLDRGFDVYDDDFHEKRWGILKSERRGEEVTRISLELLASRDKDKPLFAWFHYSEPHAPYVLHHGHDVAKAYSTHRRKATKARRNYDSEIAHTDAQIALILDALPKKDTYIVFVGDHGESLWEHDYLGHGRRVHQTGLHIPFMIHGPGIKAGRRPEPVRGVDVAPTLLGLAGFEPLDGAMGRDLLLPGLPTSRIRVVETYGGAVLRLPGIKVSMANKGPQRQAILAGAWKLIIGGPKKQLYHLDSDPSESVNLAEEHPGRVAELGKLIEDWDSTVSMAASTQAELDEDDLEALESLGYIE